MSIEIVDGTGTGKQAKVDADNRLHTQSVTTSSQASASTRGDHYNINTGDVTLTTDSQSGLLYIKNNEDNNIIITSVVYLIGNSTGGSGDVKLDILKNPSGGTVISDATQADIIQNKNFGSPKTLTADIYKGGEGKTLTGGSLAYSSRLSSAGTSYIIETGDIILTKGSKIAVRITPPSGNTSMIVQIAVAAYLKGDE